MKDVVRWTDPPGDNGLIEKAEFAASCLHAQTHVYSCAIQAASQMKNGIYIKNYCDTQNNNIIFK